MILPRRTPTILFWRRENGTKPHLCYGFGRDGGRRPACRGQPRPIHQVVTRTPPHRSRSLLLLQQSFRLGQRHRVLWDLGCRSRRADHPAAVSAHRYEPRSQRTPPLYAAAGLAVLHSLATTQAAPTNFSQRKVTQDDETALAEIFNRFERWQAARAALQVLNLGTMLWAVAESLDE